jgi:hypothetical protein
MENLAKKNSEPDIEDILGSDITKSAIKSWGGSESALRTLLQRTAQNLEDSQNTR